MSGRKEQAPKPMVLRSAGPGDTLVFTVPAALGRALREAGMVGCLFQAEVNEVGILFRFMKPNTPIEVPKWGET